MRWFRGSLRSPAADAARTACVALGLALTAACGGGSAATPTPSVAPTAAAPAPAASPQRPALASPAPSPTVAASAPAAATATPEPAAADTYEVQSGDTLLTIAQQEYGDQTQWRKIYDANRDVIGSDPDKLKIGMKLKIPPKS